MSDNTCCTFFGGTVKNSSMYAITFDLDTDILKKNYPNSSYQNAYKDIAELLVNYNFRHTQGSLYYGETVDSLSCVMAVMELTTKFPWFAPSVRNVRMLRIEDNNNLMPFIKKVSDKFQTNIK